MVLIGGASINELGQGEGGEAGDQTGKECYIQPWYAHELGWRVIRAKKSEIREKIAQDMEYICENDNIGYSYWSHCYDLYNESKKYNFNCSKVNKPCDTNCAKAVLVCAKYAGVDVEDFHTGDEVEKFLATGEFDVLDGEEYNKNPDKLLRGDILVTCKKKHTVVVINNGKEYVMYEFEASTKFCGLYQLTGDAYLRELPTKESNAVRVVEVNSVVLCDGIVCHANDRTWYHVMTDNAATPAYGFISGVLLERFET